jgi:hypothetical protein
MLTAVQYNILPSSFMFPVYVSTLEDTLLSTLQLVLQTSGCGEAEVVIFVVDKYHCILLDGRAALVLHNKSWSLSKTTSTWSLSVVVDENVTDDIGTKTKLWHFNSVCLSWFFLLNFSYSYDATFKSDLLMGYLEYPVKDNRHINQTRIYYL